jgi:prepilin-type N-terminal cleavage/methylation domain-containing protein
MWMRERLWHCQPSDSRICSASVKSNSNPAMKTQTSRRQDGFTLVELLVVIAIIAVLAGAGFAAGNAAIQKAKKTTALATVVALESAVNSFYTEYGSAPAAITTDTVYETGSGKNGIPLITTLLGLEAGTTPLNPRALKLLSVKEGKKKGASGGTNGIIYNTTGTAVDGPYKVMLDGDYDEKIITAPIGGGGATLNARRVAAWSEGADYATTKKSADDVKNW